MNVQDISNFRLPPKHGDIRRQHQLWNDMLSRCGSCLAKVHPSGSSKKTGTHHLRRRVGRPSPLHLTESTGRWRWQVARRTVLHRASKDTDRAQFPKARSGSPAHGIHDETGNVFKHQNLTSNTGVPHNSVPCLRRCGRSPEPVASLFSTNADAAASRELCRRRETQNRSQGSFASQAPRSLSGDFSVVLTLIVEGISADFSPPHFVEVPIRVP